MVYSSAAMAGEWSPESWQAKTALQQPVYPDAARLGEVLDELAQLPPLVTSWEIERLKGELAQAARGEAFLLQGGDCAESFGECTSPVIAAKLKILLQMSLILVHGIRRRVIRVGRFAGQYAKPRSEDSETKNGVTLPTYRGDNINRATYTEADRRPNPELLLRGYERAALTLNFIRSLIEGGFADLHHPEYWSLDWVKHSPNAAEYERTVEAIRDSLHFWESLAGPQQGEMSRVEYYTSHEGLHLHYEQAQTRQVPRRKEGRNSYATPTPVTAPVSGSMVYTPLATRIGGGGGQVRQGLGRRNTEKSDEKRTPSLRTANAVA